MERIEEGILILRFLGLPRAQQNERSSLTLLALLNIDKKKQWSGSEQRLIRIHDILRFIQKEYGRSYAENTRETIRRQTLHQFEQAGIVDRNPDEPCRPTNSPNIVYAITTNALETIRKYGTTDWDTALGVFIKKKGRLLDRYAKRKKENLILLDMPSGGRVPFSPGKHNELQVKIIKEFKPRFCPNAEVLYVGDTARKLLYIKKELLKAINIPITEHDKLPDVVLFNEQKKQLILIEAVTAHGPISPKRQMELEKTLKDCKAQKIYVSAFPDFREFKRHTHNIAWETEVWIADTPDHMIHFNGPKFITIHTT